MDVHRIIIAKKCKQTVAREGAAVFYMGILTKRGKSVILIKQQIFDIFFTNISQEVVLGLTKKGYIKDITIYFLFCC